MDFVTYTTSVLYLQSYILYICIVALREPVDFSDYNGFEVTGLELTVPEIARYFGDSSTNSTKMEIRM